MKLLRCFKTCVASMNQENGGTEAAQNNDAKKPSYSQAEAETICSHLSLSSVSLGRYLVLLKSDFDVDIAGEPYLALALLLNLDSGKFFTRVCDQTVTRGHAHSRTPVCLALTRCREHPLLFSTGRSTCVCIFPP